MVWGASARYPILQRHGKPCVHASQTLPAERLWECAKELLMLDALGRYERRLGRLPQPLGNGQQPRPNSIMPRWRRADSAGAGAKMTSD